MPDLTYITTGLFTAFIPESPAGIEAYNEIASHNSGVANIFTAHLKSTLSQLRKAGYTVRKAKPAPLSSIRDDELLDALMS